MPSSLTNVSRRGPGGFRNQGGASLSACASHLDLTRQRVTALANDGILTRKEDGTFDLDESRIAYVRFLRQAASRRAINGDSGAKLREARAREIELRIAREAGDLVLIEDVESVIQEATTIFVSELNALPAACTRDPALRKVIEEKVGDAIDRCRERLEQAARAEFNDEAVEVEE